MGHTTPGQRAIAVLFTESGTSSALAIDASTALTVVQRGWSRLLQHLDRTTGVNLGAIAEAIRKLGLKVYKVDTSVNMADLGTKQVQVHFENKAAMGEEFLQGVAEASCGQG